MNRSALSPSTVSTLVVLAVLCGSLIPVCLAPWPPLQDLPDWAFQARILNDLHDAGTGLSRFYALRGAPVPNSAVTLLLAWLGQLVGYAAAAKWLASLAAIAFAVSYIRFVRAWRRDYAPTAELLGAFFAVGHFFWMGYLNFQLGAAMFFWMLAGEADPRGAPIPRRLAKGAAALVVCYFCHFLAWAALLIALAGLIFARHRFEREPYARLAAAAAPSLFLLLWYAAGRLGDWTVGYAYANPVKWLWYKAAPFTLATGFYPSTPAAWEWGVVLINVMAGLLFLGLVVAAFAAWARRRSPFGPAVLVFVLVGLIGPTRFFEVIRPGERWLFLAVLIVLAISPFKLLSKPVDRRVATALVLVSVINGFAGLHASREADRLVRDMRASVPADALILNVSDSHFHFREPRSWARKAADPYSYPNWVSALKFAPDLFHIERGGLVPNLFPSGLIVTKPHDLPPVPGLNALCDAAAMRPYGALVATGTAANLDAIERTAAPLFPQPPIRRAHALILRK